MIRGTAVLRRDARGNESAANKMEVFDNLDRSGNEYIRYRCANLHPVRTASADDATIEPAAVEGEDAVNPAEGSPTTAI